MDRKRKDKKVSNTDWASPSDAEAGRTRRPGATEPFPQRIFTLRQERSGRRIAVRAAAASRPGDPHAVP